MAQTLIFASHVWHQGALRGLSVRSQTQLPPPSARTHGMTETRSCAECQETLPEDASPRRRYCSKRCTDRASKRRQRAGRVDQTEETRLRLLLERREAELRTLHTKLGQRNAQLEKMKVKRDVEHKAREAKSKDLRRARETIGAKLIRVEERLRERELQKLEQEADSFEVARLRQENARLREDIAQRDEVVRRHLNQREEDQRINRELHAKLQQYVEAAQRMQIKGEAMFTVFAHWNQVMGWFFDTTGGEVQTEAEAEWLRFWSYMHEQQPHIFQHGYIETSVEDEIGGER